MADRRDGTVGRQKDSCPSCGKSKTIVSELCQKCREKAKVVPVEDRFWPKVKVAGPDECWIWQAALDEHGYGKIMYVKGQSMKPATHISWLLRYGKWPDNRMLHTCDTPACVNPNHLFDGTQLDNIHDAIAKGRMKEPPHQKGDEHWKRRRPDLIPRGMGSGQSKLTDDDVRYIRERYACGGITFRRLGEIHGVSLQTIRAIVRRDTWNHIE
jgi:hypothetical protein